MHPLDNGRFIVAPQIPITIWEICICLMGVNRRIRTKPTYFDLLILQYSQNILGIFIAP
jgi:hypothetical protein